MEGAQALLLKTLSREEYDSIEGSLQGKIENLLSSHIDDYLTAKAKFETTKSTQDGRIRELNELHKTAVQERDDLRIKVDALTFQYEDTNKRLTISNLQLKKFREELTKLEKTVETLRKERDKAVDDCQVTSNTLERRQLEVDRLQAEVTALNADLKAAINARYEAVVLADDVQAKHIELEFKEKRFEQERTLMTQQILALTADLGKANEDTLKYKREANMVSVSLNTKVTEKDEELKISQEHNTRLAAMNEKLTVEVEQLGDKLKKQRQTEDKLIEDFQAEIKAQTKLVDLYKERLSESENRAGELSVAVKELQRLLQESSDQYGELETKLSQYELDSSATLDSKQEAITALKEELHHANILLEAVKQESSEAAVSRLSPMAASASKLLKSGLTLTQLYTKYAEVYQELIMVKAENEHLNKYMAEVFDDIKLKSQELAKQEEEFKYTVDSVEMLNNKVEELENERASLARLHNEADANLAYMTRENKRHQLTINDLSRQVCFLVREVEAARSGYVVPLTSESKADVITTSDVISKHLVTFKDIEELQLNNKKLLAALRELGEEKEQVETGADSEKIIELREDLEKVQSKLQDVLDREKLLQKEIDIIKSQRDVYHKLFKKYAKGEVVSEELKLEEPTTPEMKQVSPKKADQREASNLLEELRKDYETYKTEMKENEKMLNETITHLRNELSESARIKAEYAARAEYTDEKCKAICKKIEGMSNELTASEKRCSNYVATISKFEANLQQTRNELMSTMSKLSIAEVTVSNLKQENQLLKDNEKRIEIEQSMGRRVSHGQELLLANLEAIKVKFESNEAESRLKLEQRLDDANRETTVLRRRLQEEQDRLSHRIELLEEQTKTAKERLEEEKVSREKIAEQLDLARQEIKEKEDQIEEMHSQLNSAINKAQPVLDRETKIKELDAQLNKKESEINGLKEQLEAAKKCQAELSEVSQGIEKQLAEITEQYEQHKTESDKTIEELRNIEVELRANVRTLEVKLKTTDAAEAESRAQREAELTSLRNRVNSLSNELETTKSNLLIIEKEGKDAEKRAADSQEKVTNQALLNDTLHQEISGLKAELSDVKARLDEAVSERDRLIETSKLEKNTLVENVERLEQAVAKGDAKIAELDAVNNILQDQLQELGSKVSILDMSREVNMDIGQENVTSESFRESDKLLEVMQFVRKEKSAAIAQAEALKAEKLAYQDEVNVLKQQLNDAKKSLETERSSVYESNLSAERHAQLLSRVETLNQLTENNRSLAEDRDRLTKKLEEVENQLNSLESTVIGPSKAKISQMDKHVEQLMIENTALTAENKRWQERANNLIEKNNKNPDELKKLMLEKENLTKQLGLEKEQFKQIKIKLEEKINAMKNEKDENTGVMVSLEKILNTTKAELQTTKDTVAKSNEKISNLEQLSTNLRGQLNDQRNKEMQIRQIAKKYKAQYAELSKSVEEKDKAGPSTNAVEKTEERLKQLGDQVASLSAENESLRRENEVLKTSMGQREDRAKSLLKNAKNRIDTLSDENKNLAKELTEAKARSRVLGEGSSTVTDNRLEGRIAKLEKEKEEEQAEKDRLARELEVMTQRMNIIQRQLDKHQEKKPTTSGSEKSTSDPPTANIKPMSGTSTQTTKQVQPQPAVTVTPWRETPFASIRPMSQQTRTVVVLPTSQSTSMSNQPVLVAPQQQVAHTSSTCESLSSSPTSSLMDYMPATSSAVHNVHQATVIIGQHIDDGNSEEVSTQPPTHLVQPTPNVSIALVMPQPAQQQQEAQAEAVSAENSGIVSASNQEQVSEQSVSASNHGASAVGPTYYRDESSGSVASSQEGANLPSGSSVGSGGGIAAASSQQAASSTTSVTTSVAPAVKRPLIDDKQHLAQIKRCRIAISGDGSGEMLLRKDGLEVEYQVPTSSQRDQEEDDQDILVISDDDEMPDDGAVEDGQEFEEETEDDARYRMDAYGQDGQLIAGYDEGEGPDIDEGIDDGSATDQDNNEVDIIDDSNEVPNQSESTPRQNVNINDSGVVAEGVATTGGGEATSSLGSTTNAAVYQSTSRRPTSVPVRHHMILQSYDDTGDDSIVPSTPTLFVPRRTDGYGEAVSSPHVPSARFTFTDSAGSSRHPGVSGIAQVASEGMDDTRMDLSQLEESTSRTVPSTPLLVSPQDSNGGEIGQSSAHDLSIAGANVLTETRMNESNDQQDDTVNDDTDGVSSEAEKSVTNATIEHEEEGREAEASPTARASTSNAQPVRTIQNQGQNMPNQMARRGRFKSVHHHHNTRSHNPPTPIIWERDEHAMPMPNREAYYATRQHRSIGRGIGIIGSSDGRNQPLRPRLRRGRGNQQFQGGPNFPGQPRF